MKLSCPDWPNCSIWTNLDKHRTRLRVIEREIARTKKVLDIQKKRKETSDIQHNSNVQRNWTTERFEVCVARRREEKKQKAELDQSDREVL